jgi:Phage integrase family
MKMRAPHIVPLSRQAVETFAALRSIAGRSAYAFPSPGAEGFMSNNTMLFAMYRMGFHGRATVHGFRAVASTLLNEMGFHPDCIERQLAHDERNKVRAAYNHAQYLPERRRTMQQWAELSRRSRRRRQSHPPSVRANSNLNPGAAAPVRKLLRKPNSPRNASPRACLPAPSPVNWKRERRPRPKAAHGTRRPCH